MNLNEQWEKKKSKKLNNKEKKKKKRWATRTKQLWEKMQANLLYLKAILISMF